MIGLEADRSHVVFSDGAEGDILPVGTLIRSIQHPELTGRIKGWEYASRGTLSPWPYLIAWDDSGAAADTLGWFFVYGSDASIEPRPGANHD